VSRRHIAAFGLSLTLHVCAVLLWTFSSPPPPKAASTQAGKALAVFDATPPEDTTYPGLNPLEPFGDWTLPGGDQPSTLSIGTFSFDVRKIADHAEVLFPFLTPGVSLEHFTLIPQLHAQEHLGNPFASALDTSKPRKTGRPLVLSEAAVQATVDKAWSRHDRWQTFQPIKTLAGVYSADEGSLSNVFQAYRDQNAFQPFADTTIRDPRVWTELEIAADHVSFIGFIRQYVSEHPSTKAATELLFLLDRMAEASRNMLRTVLDTQPALQLDWTHEKNRDAYDLFEKIREFYIRQLARRNLTSADDITAYFDKVRLAILTGILRNTPGGYRANDARFLIGTIYWREHDRVDALASWREITHEMPRDTTGENTDSYVAAYTEVLRAIANRSDVTTDALKNDAALTSDIARILDAEHGRWIVFSYQRLRKFGFEFDSY
jgi:hypothetical protein